jgi:hypothetical protein
LVGTLTLKILTQENIKSSNLIKLEYCLSVCIYEYKESCLLGSELSIQFQQGSLEYLYYVLLRSMASNLILIHMLGCQLLFVESFQDSMHELHISSDQNEKQMLLFHLVEKQKRLHALIAVHLELFVIYALQFFLSKQNSKMQGTIKYICSVHFGLDIVVEHSKPFCSAVFSIQKWLECRKVQKLKILLLWQLYPFCVYYSTLLC